MKRQLQTLCLATAIMTGSATAIAANPDLYLAGLGLHQETGRNIYLGGIYLEREAPRPEDLTQAAGTRVMEYRVIARRTSIRSLLGGMLLQSEVATGRPPDQATAEFADALLSTVNTSLYAGDSLRIELTEEDVTIARLNGHELARIESPEVADYLLMGWVGESGPSTVFRDHITAGEVDPSLLSTLEANTYSAQREAEIAHWLNGREAAEPQVAVTAAQPAPVQAPVAEEPAAPLPAEAGTDGTDSATVTVAEVAPEVAAPAAETALEPVTVAARPIEETVAVTATGPSSALEVDGAPGNLQLASLVPTVHLLPENPLEREVQALGVQEYFQRLAAFHGELVRMVYGKIDYPRRAVRRGLEGRLELDVTLTAGGEVLAIDIAQASGHEMLDEAAIAATKAAFANGAVGNVDPVAIAEFGDFDSGQLTIPVPVNFLLQ